MLFKNKFTTVTVVYWVLLSYILAALIWWFIALQKQNNAMARLLLNELKTTDTAFMQKAAKIENARKRKISQYVGEGVTFMALIAVGAVFVFRATKKQIGLNQQQQNFMMAVTHELKTPIAITKLNLETMQKRKLDEQQLQKLLHNSLFETNRLNTLCNNILLAAQLDGKKKAEIFQIIDFSNIVFDAVNEYKNRFPERIIIEKIAKEVMLNGDELQLQMLVNNLIENALKYSQKTDGIEVVLQQLGNNKISFSVIDNGVGIPDNEKEKVFDKFYRIGNENTRQAKGSGLGLFLCKKIADYHGAVIALHNNQPNGCIFTVNFK